MMNQLGAKDPNRGPFKLEYDAFPSYLFPSRYGMLSEDVTPKNLYDYDPNVDEKHPLSDNHRYQGFPNKSFEKPRNPKTLDQVELDKDQLIAAPYYPYRKWFDKNKPLGGSAHTGLQYGSEDLPHTQALTSPRAIRDPFQERTSAELRKYQRVQAEVDEDFQKMKAAKQNKLNREMEEKRRDLDMLRSYDPWGKPGGGAPMPQGDNRKQKFQESELGHTIAGDVPEHLREYGDFHAHFNKPGAGAPLRTSSGSLKAELKGDTSIRFQQTKDGPNIFDKEVRYKVSGENRENLRRDLEAQQQESLARRQQEKLDDLRREIEMAKHDPYGKPGAGAPNRRSAGPITGRSITLTTNLEKLRSVERRRDQQWQQKRFENPLDPDVSGYDPWGKGYGVPNRDANGDTRRYKFSDRDVGVRTENPNDKMTYRSSPDNYSHPLGNSLDLESGRGGAGAPLKADDGHIRTRYPITMKRDEYGDSSIREQMPGKSPPRYLSDDPELQIYDPWGKGGGGAPLRDQKGHAITQVYGKIQTERLSGDARKRQNAKQDYLNELQHEMKEQRENRIRQDEDLRKGNGEFAAVIKAGRVGRPRFDNNGVLANQHLGTTDVTQGKKFKSSESQQYLSFLEREAEERERMKQLDRLKDRQEWKHHQLAMNDFWGRPGGGAPNTQGNNKKGNLTNMIHSPRNVPVDFYSKTLPMNKQPYNYVRNTTESTYKNMYDFDPQFKRASPQNKSYAMQAPWAANEKEGEVF